MSILDAVIVPHPPLIIPTMGCGREQEVQATIDAYRAAAKQVSDWGPEVLIITLPHVGCSHSSVSKNRMSGEPSGRLWTSLWKRLARR